MIQRLFVATAFAGLLASVVAACGHADSTFDCSNGTCRCPSGGTCNYSCGAPPCHIDCAEDSACTGICANGECSCGEGSSCSFACGAPPCHVTCAGNNPRCDGTCANGECTCGAGSTCGFRCSAGPCHAICPAGATCTLVCPNAGVAGTQDCDMPTCGAGAARMCPDGRTVVCGAPCPGDGG